MEFDEDFNYVYRSILKIFNCVIKIKNDKYTRHNTKNC